MIGVCLASNIDHVFTLFIYLLLFSFFYQKNDDDDDDV